MRFTGGLPETHCGRGSTMAHTAAIRGWLPHVFAAFGIRSVVDAPCGDLNWMRHVDLSGVKYTGFDADPDYVAEGQRIGLDVRQADILIDELPEADLILCRDFLQHIPNAKVQRFLDSLPGNYRWLLATQHLTGLNGDIAKDGDFRPLNLTHKPFRMGEPVIACIDGQARQLALWGL